MREVRRIVSLGLEARSSAGIKIRQPLQRLKIKNLKFKIDDGLKQLILDELNVKDVVEDASIEDAVQLDITINDELKREGMLRDLIRAVQDARKERGFSVGEIKTLEIVASKMWAEIVEAFREDIKKATTMSDVKLTVAVDTPDDYYKLEIMT